jgi:hypothetical protein
VEARPELHGVAWRSAGKAGTGVLVRAGLIGQLTALRTATDLGSHSDQPAALGMPARRDVTDRDRLVVRPLPPRQLGDLRRSGPRLAEIVRPQELQARVVVGGGQMLLDRHDDRRLSILSQTGYPLVDRRANAGLENRMVACSDSPETVWY